MNETEPHGTTPCAGGIAAWIRVETTIRERPQKSRIIKHSARCGSKGGRRIRERLVEEGPSGKYATYVNDGLEYTAKLINGVSVAPFKYMATGTGSTAEGNTQTALVAENTGADMGRKLATCTYVADYKAHWEATWTAGGAHTVRELAVFNADTAGKMAIRHVYAADKNLADAESITCRLEYTQGRAA